MVAGQAFLALVGPVGWAIAGISILTSGFFLLKGQNDKKRLENIFTLIVGQSPKDEDIVVNVCKKKHMTNTRASGSDDALRLIPPKVMSLEQAIEFITDDELIEVTPKSIRMRKRILDKSERMKAWSKNRG